MPESKLKVKGQKSKVEKTEVRVTAKKPEASKPKAVSLTVTVYSATGAESGTIALPESIFGTKVNKSLLSQALHIYETNRKSHWSNTKTRGEVEGSTRKIFKQKHTGRARHGAVRAPLFVGGGIALGPKARKTVLDFPTRMKKSALIAAFSQKAQVGEVIAVEGIEKLGGKTQQAAKLMEKLGKRSALIMDRSNKVEVIRAVRNIPSVDFLSAGQVNVFEVIAHQSLILTKDAITALEERLTKKESNVENQSVVKTEKSVKKVVKKGAVSK